MFSYFFIFPSDTPRSNPGTRAGKKEIKFTRRTRRLDAKSYFTWLCGRQVGDKGVESIVTAARFPNRFKIMALIVIGANIYYFTDKSGMTSEIR